MFKITIKRKDGKAKWREILAKVQEDTIPKKMEINEATEEMVFTFTEEPDNLIKDKVKKLGDTPWYVFWRN